MNSFTKNFAISTSSDKRKKNDFYPTPPLPVFVLNKHENFPKNITEPCAGKGHISKILTILGHNMTSKDLYSYESSLVDIESGVDLFSETHKSVITNPPYMNNIPEKMIEHYLSSGTTYLAIFCRITFLESKRRFPLFKKYPISRIYTFSDRINCAEDSMVYEDGNTQTGGMTAYAWFVWDYRNEKSNETIIKPVLAKDYIQKYNDLYK